MKAVVFENVNRWSLSTVPDPRPGDGDVLVRIDTCGICGTDRHILHGEFASTFPLIPGHKFAGTVAELSHRFPLDRFEEALKTFGRPDSYKIQLTVCSPGATDADR